MFKTVLVQFSSVQSLDRMGRWGGHDGRFNRDLPSVFSSKGHCGQFWQGLGCPLFDIVHPALLKFPLLIVVGKIETRLGLAQQYGARFANVRNFVPIRFVDDLSLQTLRLIGAVL